MTLSFSQKITVASASIIAIGLMILSFVNYSVVKSNTQESLQANLHETSQTASINIANWLNGKLQAVQSVADATKHISDDMDRSHLSVVKNANTFISVYVASEKGAMVMDDPTQALPADFDPRKRPWYIQAKESGTGSFTEPYRDAASGELLLSGLAPIKENGRFIGVVAADLSLDYIAEMLGLVNFSGKGQVFLVSNKGDILVHNDASMNGKDITELYPEHGKKLHENLVVQQRSGRNYLVGYYAIKGLSSLDWYLAVEVDEEKAFSSMDDMRNSALLLTPISVIIAIILLTLLLNRLTKPLRELKVAMQDIAEGDADLTQRLQVTTQDELGELAKFFNEFVSNIHHMMQEFKSQSDEMNLIAKQMNDISEHSKHEMGVQRQETEQVATAVAEMSAAASEIALNAQGAAEAAHEADEERVITNQVVEEAISSIQGLADNLTSAEKDIAELEEEVSGISTVLDVIRGIAEQTNLLALNAAIEAARAGEQGRGFAVVADEVRSLAGKTQESTKEINAKIESLQNGARRAVDSMKNSRATSDISVQKATETGISLGKISQSVSRMSEMNLQIATASEQQTNVTEEIARNVTNISDATERTYEGANQTVDTSQQLSSIGGNIDKEVNKFII
ncbi:MAG: methyl-accepting chemotaxis protein [Alteromonadales bacterium]|nr:methyl-accepting chemotaxis protein [Alteromonadales bacterium]